MNAEAADPPATPPRGFLRGCDACCVIGGDGTLLGVAQEAARAQVPIIGVNRGGLGFLTTFSADEARAHFADLLWGAFRVDRRAMLDCTIGQGPHALALNDVLIKAALPSGLVRLEVYADNEAGDRLPLRRPDLLHADRFDRLQPVRGRTHRPSAAKVISMTPICPHTLSNRTIIFRDDVRLRVQNRTAGVQLLVAVDGQRQLAARPDLPVRLAIAKRRLSLADGRLFALRRRPRQAAVERRLRRE